MKEDLIITLQDGDKLVKSKVKRSIFTNKKAQLHNYWLWLMYQELITQVDK